MNERTNEQTNKQTKQNKQTRKKNKTKCRPNFKQISKPSNYQNKITCFSKMRAATFSEIFCKCLDLPETFVDFTG